MLKGFKDFLLRGNVVELATAVIIGAAFTAIVTAFTEKIINPLIASIPVNTDLGGLGFEVSKGKVNADGSLATFLDFGAVLTAVINFVIVAAVVYFIIIVPFNKLSELRKLEEDEDGADEISLLAEIRDLLDPTAAERKAAAALAAAEAEAEEARVRAEAAAREEAARAEATARAEAAAPAPQAAPQYGQPHGQPGATQQLNVPPQAPQYNQPPSSGFPTPNPAPGEYPPPGTLPQGQYAPGQYPPPGQYPGGPADGPRHSR